MSTRVIITGLGVIAPNGIGEAEFTQALRSGKSGIGLITHFDSSNFKNKVAAEIKGFDAADYMPISVVRKTDRFSQLGVAAAGMAIKSAKLSEDDKSLSNAAVIIGSGLGGSNFHEEMIIAFVESSNPRRVAASSVPRITPNAVSAYIALQHKIKGPNQVISTACSSSAQAIGEAFERVRSGRSSIAITGGVDAPVSSVNIAMYQSMMVLGSSLNGNIEEASRPFDRTRNGFVIGEAAACFVLEELNYAKARGANMIAEIAGFGSNCGAYHMVTPDPTGEDAAEAMKAAIEDANINVEEIDYIAAHGTSTKLNDLAETRAIKAVFQDRAYKIPVSSIKSMIGHTIGAAGAAQAAACCVALKNNFIPPTTNLKVSDSECDLDYVPNEARKKEVNVIISNSFGFGSNNASLVLRRISNE
jgi:3-oxoacyl-[acyl-carrier-protein] synthase II